MLSLITMNGVFGEVFCIVKKDGGHPDFLLKQDCVSLNNGTTQLVSRIWKMVGNSSQNMYLDFMYFFSECGQVEVV